MKRYFYSSIIALGFSLVSCYNPQSDPHIESGKSLDNKDKVSIKISGSTTMLPIMELISEHYMMGHKNYDFVYDAQGSNLGMKSLFEDKADLAMSSNHISTTAKTEFRKNKSEYVELLLAGDALVFAVNVNNPVQKLTKEQVEQIFTGKIQNWKDLGGEDLPIIVLSRDSLSGTYSFLKETVLHENKMANNKEVLNSNEEILQRVSADKSTIAYTSFSSLNYSVEPVNISFDSGKTYVKPRVETVNNMSYKYFRGLYLYYKPNKYEKLKSFIQTVKSDTVQTLIKKNRYIPINNSLIQNQ